MKVLGFAASSSINSINKKLVTYAVGMLADAEIEILDLNDYELPLFSVDREKELGQPELAQAFLAKIQAADAVVISFAEHNGSYSAAYKNLFDWVSRINTKVFEAKSMVLLSASPGGRGGVGVMASASASVPHFGGEVKATFSLPTFYDNFDVDSGVIKNPKLDAELKTTMAKL